MDEAQISDLIREGLEKLIDITVTYSNLWLDSVAGTMNRQGNVFKCDCSSNHWLALITDSYTIFVNLSFIHGPCRKQRPDLETITNEVVFFIHIHFIN
ncbi:hypothetical protein PoB_004569000 [Plakobranchus ocellatus]|uniref:Uncharacterized protein n=1 Tax=Plakobranchus ocellatus TaxID=259542 RepID=A0AAV4BJH3_9GAST|nr:hypothetical protein PoB_004569000 [Plakobranchus ocellatus]